MIKASKTIFLQQRRHVVWKLTEMAETTMAGNPPGHAVKHTLVCVCVCVYMCTGEGACMFVCVCVWTNVLKAYSTIQHHPVLAEVIADKNKMGKQFSNHWLWPTSTNTECFGVQAPIKGRQNWCSRTETWHNNSQVMCEEWRRTKLGVPLLDRMMS